jgi:hypothetical protein
MKYEGRHRVERIEAMCERTGWGPLRLPGERRRMVRAHNKATRLMGALR